MAKCWKYWRDHSLTIIVWAIGIGLTGWAIWLIWPLEPKDWFDVLTGLGAGVLTVALFNVLSGPFREVNKPDE